MLALFWQVLLGVVKVFSTALAVWRIDSLGRRFFLLAGLSLMTVRAADPPTLVVTGLLALLG